MSILIIGGAGYIGSHANKMLSQNGYNTIVLDNLCRGFKESIKWGKFIEGNFSDIELLEKIFIEENIQVVMHFSAFAYVGESIMNPSEYYNNNVINTIKLLDCMVKNEIKYFIFSSSCATFGNAEYLPIDENHPQYPINPYGNTKLIIEKVLKDYDIAYGLKSCVLRYFNAAGADPDGEIGEMHDPETHLIPLVFFAAFKKIPELSIFGNNYDTKDGTCIRDYLHVNDIANAHILAMKWIKDNQISNDFNLGTSTGNSIFEVINTIERITDKKVTYKICPKREGDPAVLVASSQKAHNVLNWQIEFDTLEKIINTAWEWYKNIL